LAMTRYPAPLPADEQIALCLRAQAGDRRARDRLVETTMSFVKSRALFFAARTKGSDLEDFIGEGSLGLIRAVETFDPTRGSRFVTYAQNWIDAAIRSRGVTFVRGIRASDTARSSFLSEYRAHRDEGLTHDEAVARVGKDHRARPQTAGVVIQSLQGRIHASLDAAIGPDDDGESLYEFLPARETPVDERLARVAFEREVRAAFEDFCERFRYREREILRARFFADDDVTLRELGERFGCSRERIRQIEATLREKLRAHLAETWFGRTILARIDAAREGAA